MHDLISSVSFKSFKSFQVDFLLIDSSEFDLRYAISNYVDSLSPTSNIRH